MTAARLDLVIDKNTQWIQEMDIEFEDTNAVSLVGQSVKMVIKESYSTSTVLLQLTEGNGGVTILDDAGGKFVLTINADDTDMGVDYAVYDLVLVSDTDPEDEIEKLLFGKIEFREGTV